MVEIGMNNVVTCI